MRARTNAIMSQSMMAKGVGIDSWGRHIEGAMQLVRARGRSLLKTKLGESLFIAVRTQMVCTLGHPYLPSSAI
jgi:hypothetical protein